MKNLATLPDLLPYYEEVVQALRSKGVLTTGQGVDLAVSLYREVRMGAAVPGDDKDEDMLLFQYGLQNWHDGRGEFFGLDITRQVMVEEDEDQLIYQLSLEFEFDPTPFAACVAYNSWSPTLPALSEWVSTQKATSGFKLTQTVPVRGINLGVEQV